MSRLNHIRQRATRDRRPIAWMPWHRRTWADQYFAGRVSDVIFAVNVHVRMRIGNSWRASCVGAS